MANQAIILCAGIGSRMGELTKNIPKPMIIVDGMSLIERHMHYLLKNNIYKLVINTFYKAKILEEFILSLEISKQFEISFSREDSLLGTGGGVKKALKFLGKEPFFVINNDSIFVDKEISAFELLKSNWNQEKMPILMLLTQRNNSFGYWARGDFDMDDQGRLNRGNKDWNYINPGMYITDYKLFDPYQEEKLEMFPTVFEDLIKKNNLYGCPYNGNWFHIGDLKAYDLFIKSNLKV